MHPFVTCCPPPQSNQRWEGVDLRAKGVEKLTGSLGEVRVDRVTQIYQVEINIGSGAFGLP